MSFLNEARSNEGKTQGNFQSANNSWGYNPDEDLVTLASGQTLTGKWELNARPSVMISAVVTGGDATLFVDTSIDGQLTTSTFPSAGLSMADGISIFHVIVKGSRFFRIRLTAGSDNLTSVKIHTESGTFPQPNAPQSSALSRTADAIAVRSTDFYQEVQESRRSGYFMETKFGHNPSAGTGAEDVINSGGDYAGHPTSFTPELLEVFSSDVNDTSAGTGARTIRISGLKTSTSTAYESEDITLNGTTGVNSTNTWWRVNRAYVLTAGSGAANAGTITVRAATTTTVIFVTVAAGDNQSHFTVWTVPANNTAWLKRVHLQITRAAGAGVAAEATFRVREPGGVFRARRIYNFTGEAPVDYTALGGLEMVAGSDIKMRVESSSTASPVEASLEMLVVED